MLYEVITLFGHFAGFVEDAIEAVEGADHLGRLDPVERIEDRLRDAAGAHQLVAASYNFV